MTTVGRYKLATNLLGKLPQVTITKIHNGDIHCKVVNQLVVISNNIPIYPDGYSLIVAKLKERNIPPIPSADIFLTKVRKGISKVKNQLCFPFS